VRDRETEERSVNDELFPEDDGPEEATVSAPVGSTPIRAYTDGACSGNPGPGGWAWVVPGGPYAAGWDGRTTNQRMEITAALEAVRAHQAGELGEGPLTVVSDSTYVVNCFRDRWWEGWLRRGWINSQKKPVANRDLWEPLIELVRARGDVSFEWVKGHNGDEWNDRADALAVEACQLQTDLRG
jgi:ribonuclease HI